ncbi:MAG: ArnT family glycosyltransferase [Acidobacteriota bacterium]
MSTESRSASSYRTVEAQPWGGFPKWLLPITAVALLLRLYGLGWGLPFEFHPDESLILAVATGLHWGDLNPHFFLYPSLFIYQAAFVQWLMGLTSVASAERIIYVARLLSVLYSTLTVLLVYALASRLGGRRLGLWAAAFYAVLGASVLHAHYATTDTAMTALATASVWLSMRAWQRRDLRRQLWAAAMVGLAASIKYSAAPALLVPLVACWLSGVERRRKLRQVAAFSLAIGAVALALFILTSPYVLLDFHGFLDAQAEQAQNQMLARSGYHVPPSEGLGWTDRGLFRNLVQVNHDLGAVGSAMVLLALATVLVGLVSTARQPLGDGTGRARVHEVAGEAKSWMLAAIWPVGLYLLMAPSALVAQRYMLPMYPLMAVLAAMGLERLGEWLGGAMRRLVALPERAEVFAAGLLSMLLLTSLLAVPGLEGINISRLLGRTDTRLVAREWILQHLPLGAGLAIEFYSPPFWDSDGFRVSKDSFSLTRRPLSWYCDQDYRYLLTSSLNYRRYLQDESARFRRQERWYRRLFRNARLIRRFEGEEYGFHHPTLEVYRLNCFP